MNISLLDPPNLKSREYYHEVSNAPLCSHLFSGYVGAVLRDSGFNVFIFSGDATLPESFELLGVNLMYLWERTDEIFSFLEKLKNERNFHLNLFGYYPTFSYEYILSRYPFVDSITVGEPEESFHKLACALRNKETPNNIKGIAVRNQDKFEKSEILNPNKLPFPMRAGDGKSEFFYILGSRGCPFKCSFCYVNNIYGEHSGWRGRDVDNILDEIESLMKEYGVKYFYFADANFLGPLSGALARVQEFYKRVQERKLEFEFGMECRASDITEPTVRLLQKAGLKNIFLGIESGSDAALSRYCKGTNTQKNAEAIGLVREKRIYLSYGWIMFDPQTTLKDLVENFSFLLENSLLDCPTNTAHLLYHKVWLFRGTHAFEKTIKDGKTDSAKPEEMLKMGYEKDCGFSDPVVEQLYYFISPLSQNVLNYTMGKDLGNREDSKYSAINEALIKGFGDALMYSQKNSREKTREFCQAISKDMQKHLQ